MVAPVVGNWLRGTRGTLTNAIWDVAFGLIAPAGWKWQWLRDDVEIDGATEQYYQVQAGDVGAVIKCRVTPVDQRFRDGDPINTIGTDPVGP